jgi:hypothetical protein
VVRLGLFHAVGNPFGAIDDWLIGVFALLAGLFAFVFNR